MKLGNFGNGRWAGPGIGIRGVKWRFCEFLRLDEIDLAPIRKGMVDVTWRR